VSQFSIDVRSNAPEVLEYLRREIPRKVDSKIASGLNKAMTAAGKQAIKQASAEIGLPAKYLRARTERSRASRTRLRAITRFAPRGLNPAKIGLSPAQALAFYKGPRLGQAFAMTLANGSRAYAGRLPSSRDPSPPRSAAGARRMYRLPVQVLRIFIGKKTIKAFDQALAGIGARTFDAELEALVKQLNTGA